MTPNAATAFLPLLTVALIACSPPEQDSAISHTQRSSAPLSAAMTVGGPMMGMHGAMGGGMGANMQDMRSIRGLLANHDSIERKVEDLANGVRTVTVSDDPEIALLIRTHVRQMRDRYQRDQPIRRMDPLFRELFKHRKEARLEIRDIPGGVEVVHTSANPHVVALIRQHSRHFVNVVVDRGMAGAMRPIPLPDGYADR